MCSDKLPPFEPAHDLLLQAVRRAFREALRLELTGIDEPHQRQEALMRLKAKLTHLLHHAPASGSIVAQVADHAILAAQLQAAIDDLTDERGG